MIGWIVLTLVVAGIAAVAWGASHIQANMFIRAVHRGNTADKKIALTFDDGPHLTYTPAVLHLLSQHRAKATFFCIGKNAEQYPGIVAQAHQAGHAIGNHSYTHAATIDFQLQRGWLDELHQTDDVIERTIGHRPAFFRPPYGVTTPHLAGAVRASGHRVIGWCIRPYDTVKSRTPEHIVGTILQQVKPGAIILLHDTHDRIVPVLEQLLPKLCERGYALVTVAELIEQHAYTKT